MPNSKPLGLVETIKDIATRCENSHLVRVVSGHSLVGTQSTLEMGTDNKGNGDRDLRPYQVS